MYMYMYVYVVYVLLIFLILFIYLFVNLEGGDPFWKGTFLELFKATTFQFVLRKVVDSAFFIDEVKVTTGKVKMLTGGSFTFYEYVLGCSNFM